MTVKRYKPTSPARRYYEVLSSQGLTKNAVAALVTRLSSAGETA